MKTLLAALVVLAFAPPALADGGPSPGAAVGGPGVVGSGIRYVTIGNGRKTNLAALTLKGGRVKGWVAAPGGFGIPYVTFEGTTGGLSHDGSTLVLAQTNPFACLPSGCSAGTTSQFAVYTPRTLARRQLVELTGSFSYDALSPDGRMLYLIQYLPTLGSADYKVRAYDLANRRLEPGAIADRAQKGWTMQGQPMARVISADGRFVYTLYENQGGYPFVHALDTVAGVAHCIGLPMGDQRLIGKMRLTVREGGRTLSVADPSSRRTPSFAIDTATYAVSRPPRAAPGGFPWWTLGLLALPLLAGGFLLAARRRGVRAPGFGSERIAAA